VALVRTIVIVGGGFCGTVLAANLLRRPPPVPGPHLFYVGPMLRADLWEATAASELPVHAERLATLLATERT
jgi:uncharacterized NAD(P)/FAD-binding protein YdhS